MSILSLDEFEQAALENIRKHLPIQYGAAEVRIVPLVKLGKTYRALSIVSDQPGISGISVSLTDLYERYRKVGNLEAVLDEVFSGLFVSAPDETQTILSDYDNIRDRLFIRLSNTARNREILGAVPYTPFLDLAVTYHFLLKKDESGMSSVMITDALLNGFGVTKKQLHEDAIRSSQELFPVLFENSMEFIRMHAKSIVLPEEERDISGSEMKILTNEYGMNGAAVIVYPETARKISDALGSSYCIIPSSVHELYIAAGLKNENLYEMQQMVRHVNARYVSDEEFLSDNLYIYNREIGEICMIGFDDRAGWLS